MIVGGILGCLNANQTGLLAGFVSGTSFQLTTLEGTAVNTTSAGAYTSGGYALDLTLGAVITDFAGNTVGTDPTLAGQTSSKGVANATSPITWTTVPTGNPAQVVVIYDSTVSNDAILIQDGKIRVVTVGDTPSSSTTMKVQPIRAQLWDGTTGSAPVLYFNNGRSATLNAAAAMGTDALTVTSTGFDIPDLSTADVLAFGAGLPVTPSGGSISFNIGSIYAPLTPTGIYEL
jgi:hypothetical protein